MARGKASTVSPAGAHFQAMGVIGEGEEPVVPRKFTGWLTAQEILGLWMDTKNMTVGPPQRKLENLQ